MPPPRGRGRGVDNRPAWMTRPEGRVHEAAPGPASSRPMSIQGFIKATGHAAPGDAAAPEPKRAKRNGRRGAADFFD